ncbi:hypothetical protein MPTK1_7g16490 [Marchantia polymorpha subsp. ruderalis]|uniref:Uncharacterized protein n=2 Tax=Marchantia polymorpha TaxID=3197 RepID=A0AAF6C0D7_MARPO|nr:hypothetical protein MARPO_0123s0031 [Marchantia polymorpha]BBN17721.1 hypothetical protein Mp_7g16490 [Marchantia polymorpha subsp. ruderalis]|eukprot:PTQ30544.1 hypothetical protein MARPO_0123s0031 [Marchantia polymorpha]
MLLRCPGKTPLFSLCRLLESAQSGKNGARPSRAPPEHTESTVAVSIPVVRTLDSEVIASNQSGSCNSCSQSKLLKALLLLFTPLRRHRIKYSEPFRRLWSERARPNLNLELSLFLSLCVFPPPPLQTRSVILADREANRFLVFG